MEKRTVGLLEFNETYVDLLLENPPLDLGCISARSGYLHGMFRFFLGLILFAASLQAREWIVLSGGPALRFYEAGKTNSHDKHWGNFIDSAVVRIKDLKTQLPEGDQITWLVYRPGYQDRGREMGADLLGNILKRANQEGVALFWVDGQDQLVNYFNGGKDRSVHKIHHFDYFGHSNKACFLFDYSNVMDSMSKDYLHTSNLKRLKKDLFTPDAVCQSWGCHSGEYYSAKWKEQFGVPMTGAVGKTDYSRLHSLPFLSSDKGRWAQ
jgi:hypothetical protein